MQQDNAKAMSYYPTKQPQTTEASLQQQEYCYDELNANEDSAEWQEFAQLQLRPLAER